MGQQPSMHARRTAQVAEGRQQQKGRGGQQGQENPEDAQDQGKRTQSGVQGADHGEDSIKRTGRRAADSSADQDTSRQGRIRELLIQVPLFNELPAAELEPIVQGTSELAIPKGGIVFRRGDPCVGFHVVVYGQVKLVFVSTSGVERVVRLIGPGDGFGEALMFMGKNYIVTAEALRDTLLLHVDRDALFQQIDRNPGVARKMLAGLSSRLYSLMGDVEAYTLHTGGQRLVSFLLREWPGQENRPFRIEISKSVIASRLNLTPEHFSRILRELSERGLIRVRGREFTVLDAAGLRKHHA